MALMILMESAAAGVLMVNGQFCGPMEPCGQAFPVGKYAEVYIQLFPFDPAVSPLTAALIIRDGQVARLEPQAHAYAVHWPDGVIELELRPAGMGEAAPQARADAAQAGGVLLRYLGLRLAGDAQAALLLAPRVSAPDLAGYQAAVPLPYAPAGLREGYDERAGLLRRTGENTAVVDAALARTAPAGQGRRVIAQITLLPAAQGSG